MTIAKDISKFNANRLSVAPMLDWTDRHCRYFHRLMTSQTLLYTEMVTTGAIIHGKGDFLAYNQEEHPVALQLGGSNPADLAHCAKLAQDSVITSYSIHYTKLYDRFRTKARSATISAYALMFAALGVFFAKSAR